jgi:ABC-type nitrate/sulfonate/bicarbonate transport system ATPase subunit
MAYEPISIDRFAKSFVPSHPGQRISSRVVSIHSTTGQSGETVRGAAALTGTAALSFARVSKRFQRDGHAPLEVLRDVSFDVPDGKIVAILGASGSGKTTLLNMAAGLILPDQGLVLVMGEPTSGRVDWSRVGYMFQDDRLLPWRVSASNVALALEGGSMRKSERLRRAKDALSFVGLSEFAQAYPHQLSGGMRSRIALARSLVAEPNILLMDEPFSRLDAQTRSALHRELLQIHAVRKISILFVTHDVEEAVTLASRIVVLSPRPGHVNRIVDVDQVQTDIESQQARSLVIELRSIIAETAENEDAHL